jgi:hypothetical protein
MVNYVSSYSTLYNSGASGDNLIPDGYVRAVEKVWIDSYIFNTASTALMTTSDTLVIGYIPANKKIVGVEVYLPTTWAPTNCAINVGPSYATAVLISNSTAYVGGTNSTLVYNVVRMNNQPGFAYVVTSGTTAVSGGVILTNVNTPIYLSLTGANLTTPTSGTLSTIIRYT